VAPRQTWASCATRWLWVVAPTAKTTGVPTRMSQPRPAVIVPQILLNRYITSSSPGARRDACPRA
jgi:hypothetical protein